jgi:hypothetical protein
MRKIFFLCNTYVTLTLTCLFDQSRTSPSLKETCPI